MRLSHVLTITGLACALPLHGTGAAPPPPPAGSMGELSKVGRVALVASSVIPARGRKCLYRHLYELGAEELETVGPFVSNMPDAADRAELLGLLARTGDTSESRIPEADDPILRGFGIHITEVKYNKEALKECDFVGGVRTPVMGARYAITVMSYTSQDMRGLVATAPIVLSRTAVGWHIRYVGKGTLWTLH